jgi:hypothetical protein
MARAVVRYAFIALLALLSTQGVVPSVRVLVGFEVVCSAEAEQQTPRKSYPIRTAAPTRQSAPYYVSRNRPEPDTTALFQRPPPIRSLFA